MGLRNARRRFRPVLPRPVSPAIAAPEAPDLGRERLLHANIGNSLPDDVRPRAASTRARPTCAGVGCGRRAWVICSPTGTDSRRQANPLISGNEKADHVTNMGAVGIIDRRNFDCWGALPDMNDTDGFNAYMKRCRSFGRAIWDITGKGNDVDMVFEHPGEATFPISCMVAKRGGMVVFCAGTTGYNLTFDARYVWMRQKRIQGSHFATLKQAAEANQLMGGLILA